MDESESLREQAERCFRLARVIDDRDVIVKLLQLGRQYEEQARHIEGAAAAQRKDAISN